MGDSSGKKVTLFLTEEDFRILKIMGKVSGDFFYVPWKIGNKIFNIYLQFDENCGPNGVQVEPIIKANSVILISPRTFSVLLDRKRIGLPCLFGRIVIGKTRGTLELNEMRIMKEITDRAKTGHPF
ncbi:MAG TPA: hypothetical protein P5052_03870 [Candidatus Paceibacterota bacterium]|nr:hypothetical protein [Candidatus Paceibacterota bacterium]